MRVSWTRRAMADLEKLADYFEPQSSRRWHELLDRIVRRTELLEIHPQHGQRELLLAARNPTRDYRYVLVEKYKIVYYLEGETVFISQIFDSRSDPANLRN